MKKGLHIYIGVYMYVCFTHLEIWLSDTCVLFLSLTAKLLLLNLKNKWK